MSTSEENHIYRPDVLISSHTNKPFEEGVKSSKEYKFWCEQCHKLMYGVRASLYHMHGKSHTRKNAKREAANETTNKNATNSQERKRNLAALSDEPITQQDVDGTEVSVSVEQPLKKKKKEKRKETDPKPEFKCDDCSLVFTSAVIAITHFKGKKHIKKVSEKQNQTGAQGAQSGRFRFDPFTSGSGRGMNPAPPSLLGPFHGLKSNYGTLTQNFGSPNNGYFSSSVGSRAPNNTLQSTSGFGGRYPFGSSIGVGAANNFPHQRGFGKIVRGRRNYHDAMRGGGSEMETLPYGTFY